MQPAPAVSFLCEDGGAWRAVTAALHGTTAAVVAGWLLGWAWPGQGLAALGALVLGVATGAAAWRRGGHGPARLAWDTQRWQLQDGAVGPRPGRVEVSMDLGRWMLLRFRPELGRDTRWLAVGSAAGPAARAALYGVPPPPERRVD